MCQGWHFLLLICFTTSVTKKGSTNAKPFFASISKMDESELRSERKQGQRGQLEALFPEGYADDGDEEKDAGDGIPQGVFPAKENQPDDVGDWVLVEVGFDCLSKREGDKFGDFETLFSERNSDDGDAPEDSRKRPKDAGPQTDEYEPKDVS